MQCYRLCTRIAAALLALGVSAPALAAQPGRSIVVAQAVSSEEANRRGDGAYDRKDYAEAMRWYRISADGGYALGAANVGYLYSQGLGVPANDSEAIYWYTKAAEGGQREAQYNLGLRFESGRGVPKDLTRARYWIQRAAAAGDSDAQKWLTQH